MNPIHNMHYAPRYHAELDSAPVSPEVKMKALVKCRDNNLHLAESYKAKRPDWSASYRKAAERFQKQIDNLEEELKRDLEWLGGPQTISLDQLPGLLFAVALAFNPTDEWVRRCEAQILAEEAKLNPNTAELEGSDNTVAGILRETGIGEGRP